MPEIMGYFEGVFFDFFLCFLMLLKASKPIRTAATSSKLPIIGILSGIISQKPADGLRRYKTEMARSI